MAECFAHRRHGTELADNAKCVFLMTAWQPRMTCERAGIGVAQRTLCSALGATPDARSFVQYSTSLCTTDPSIALPT